MPADRSHLLPHPGAAVAARPRNSPTLPPSIRPAGSRTPSRWSTATQTRPSYGSVVGWAELPTAGNELHHFGWNACSSALCHEGHDQHNGLERRYLLVPGIRSSTTYVLDTKPDPRNPVLKHIIEADELAAKAGYSRPHTVHCGPGGIFMSALGGANGDEGPGGVALLDHDTFEVVGPWEEDRGAQFFAYDFWWHLQQDTVVTSEWASPSMIENGLESRGPAGPQVRSPPELLEHVGAQAQPAHRPRRRASNGAGVAPGP